MHSGIDAVRTIMANHDVKAEDVAEIVMGANRQSISHIGAKPTDITSAQFSAGFGIALTLVRGSNGLKDYKSR